MNSGGAGGSNIYAKPGKQFNTISASQSNQHGLTPTPILHNAGGPTSFQNSNAQLANDGTKSAGNKMLGKVNQKSHLRSLTQHKIEHPATASNGEQLGLNHQQRNGGRRQPSASGKSAKNVGSAGTLQPSMKMDTRDDGHDGASAPQDTYG